MKSKTVGHKISTNSTLAPGDALTPEYGLMADGIIMTLKGDMQVRTIRSGDRIVTRDSGIAVVKHIRSHRITGATVRIKAGSIGHVRPDRDVTLPSAQPILIRDWRAQALSGVKQALVPAAQLVDGEFITLHAPTTLTVYKIEFDRPHILYVDGLELAGHIAAETTAKAA